MTVEERNNILAKECLSIRDIMALYDMNYQSASGVIRDIKTKLTIGQKKELRLDVQGRIHTEDYLDYVGVRKSNRYNIGEKINEQDFQQSM